VVVEQVGRWAERVATSLHTVGPPRVVRKRRLEQAQRMLRRDLHLRLAVSMRVTSPQFAAAAVPTTLAANVSRSAPPL
jgi:hypothetical protein